VRVRFRGRPKGGTQAQTATVTPRPPVVSEGCELEIVWYAHRHAASLLPADYPTVDGAAQVEVSGLGRRIALTRLERRTGGSR
jgi:hypothetical protein